MVVGQKVVGMRANFEARHFRLGIAHRRYGDEPSLVLEFHLVVGGCFCRIACRAVLCLALAKAFAELASDFAECRLFAGRQAIEKTAAIAPGFELHNLV
jgi:hypothetical protein